MTTTAPDAVELADVAVTPADLLARVRAERAAADRAEAAVVVLAVEWAHAHPAMPGDEAWRVTDADAVPWVEDPGFADEEALEGYGIPEVHWAAPAAFAAANNMSTAAGRAFLRDALVLRHRLPRVYAGVVAGRVQVWRARRIAQAVLGAPADVVAHIDATVGPVAHKVGPVTLTRLLEEAMARLHAEEAEVAQVEAFESRRAVLDERSTPIHGLAHMEICADWKDLRDFDQTLGALAAKLKDTDRGEHESLQVRRSMAVGILADPATALALLGDQPAPRPVKQTVLYLHLTDHALAGRDPVGRNETTGQPVLVQQVRDWCGRTDAHLSIRPVIDLNQHHAVETYEVPDRLAERIALTHPTCVFPWCSRSARRCDCDHTIPHAAGGPTCQSNLAPLCRHHHRLKTHAGWTYTRIEPGVYLWTSPHLHQLLRDPDGTTHLAPD